MKPKNIPLKPIKLTKDKEVLEKDIEEDNRKYCKKLGVLFEKFTSPQRRSVPDRLLTFPNGLMVFIEYKAPGKRPTPKQWEDHCKRREMGVLVYVVDNAEVGRKLIDKLKDLDSQDDKRCNWMEWQLTTRHYLSKDCVEPSYA